MYSQHFEASVIEFVRKLIQIPSENPPGRELAVAAYISRYFERLGLRAVTVGVDRQRPNLIVTADFGPGPTLIMAGHMDVAPPGEGWTIPPYDAVIRDGRVYGRGAADIKGGLAAMMAVAGALVRLSNELSGRFIQVFSADEEMGGGIGVGHLVRSGLLAGDMAIVCEPTDLQVVTREGGLVWLEVEVRGRPTHSALAGSGPNPVEGIVELIHELGTVARAVKAEVTAGGRGVFSVNIVQGGLKTNMVPASCRACIDVRLPMFSRISLEDVVQRVRTVVDDANGRHRALTLTMAHSELLGAFEVPDTEPIVDIAARAVAAETGRSVSEVIGHSSVVNSDLNHLWRTAGIPGVCMGPGSVQLSHAPDEYVEIEQLRQAARILLAIAKESLAR